MKPFVIALLALLVGCAPHPYKTLHYRVDAHTIIDTGATITSLNPYTAEYEVLHDPKRTIKVITGGGIVERKVQYVRLKYAGCDVSVLATIKADGEPLVDSLLGRDWIERCNVLVEVY